MTNSAELLISLKAKFFQQHSDRVSRVDKVQGSPEFRGPWVPDSYWTCWYRAFKCI